MNPNIFNPLPPPKVFIDTTVMCGAFLKPGINRKILELGAATSFFRTVISRACLMEFYVTSLSKGLSNRIYSYEIVSEFLDAFVYPILDEQPAINSVIGRNDVDIVIRGHKPLGQALIELSNCSTDEAKEIINQQHMKIPLNEYDHNDFHVWVTAIKENCSYIVYSNTNRFPETTGQIQRIGPVDFYRQFID